MLDVISKIKDRVDRPDPAKPFAVFTGERAFNETFYAGAYGRLCGAIEDIRTQIDSGATLNDLQI